MSDLVKDLLAACCDWDGTPIRGNCPPFSVVTCDQIIEAADRIAKLEAELAKNVSLNLAEERHRIAKLEAALRWYGDKAAGCRKVTSEGNDARHALDCDGGKLAREVLGRGE